MSASVAVRLAQTDAAVDFVANAIAAVRNFSAGLRAIKPIEAAELAGTECAAEPEVRVAGPVTLRELSRLASLSETTSSSVQAALERLAQRA